MVKPVSAGEASGRGSGAGGEKSLGKEGLQKPSETAASKAANSAETVVTNHVIAAPADLHGDWITIERKKLPSKNNNANSVKRNGGPPKNNNSARYNALLNEQANELTQ